MSHSRLDEAIGCFERSLAVNPDARGSFFSLLHLRGRVCDWREWDAMFVKARSLIDQGITGGMGPIFALAYPITAEQLCGLTRYRASEAVSLLGQDREDFVPWQPT